MSNSLLTISMITKESLRILKNELGFTKNVNRQYDDKFAKEGAKIGSVINIRKPVRYTVSDGPSLVVQDVTDQSVPLTLSSQKHVGFQFSSKDLTLSMDEFSARYVAPAVVALANKVDLDGLSQYKNVAQFVGTPGTTPATSLIYLQAMQKLNEAAAPIPDRTVLINPAAQASTVDALKGLFQSSEKIAEQYEKGVMGVAFGGKFMMAQNIQSQTVGALGGTPLYTASGSSGATVVTRGWTSAASNRLKAGDCITIANVYAVNPQTLQSTGALKQFVVTADFSSDGSGNGSVTVSPAIVLTGPYQNVNVAPVDGAAILTFGAVSSTGGVVTPTNLIYHKDAFALGCADLELPGGVDMAARATDAESGLSVRMVRQYDINNDTMPCRLDILYGWATLYAELACRLQG